MRPSRQGNYLGLTLVVRAESKTQLDAIYHALTKHPMVKVAL
jgi:putative lipoic acid-binding regulatory protein